MLLACIVELVHSGQHHLRFARTGSQIFGSGQMHFPSWRWLLIALPVALAACDAPKTTSTSAPPATQPASVAQPTIYNGLTMTQLQSILVVGNQAFTQVNNSAVKLNGGPQIDLLSCSSGEPAVCKTMLVIGAAGNVIPPLEAVNTWNRDHRFPQVATDAAGKLLIMTWVSTTGITSAAVLDSLDTFHSLFEDENFKFWLPYADH